MDAQRLKNLAAAAAWVVTVAAPGSMAMAAAESPSSNPEAQRAMEAACTGLPEAVRDRDPLAREVFQARLLSERTGKQRVRQILGSELQLMAKPGVTEAWLHRVLDCHAKQHAAMLGRAPGADVSPLAVPGVEVRVQSEGGTFAVRVLAEGNAKAREVHRRAEALVESYREPASTPPLLLGATDKPTCERQEDC